MRILHIMGGADAGGVAAVVYNYMRFIDQDKFHFDFALTGYEPGMLGNKMIDAGAKYYYLPRIHDGIKEFRSQLSKLLKKEHFDVIHMHGNSNSWIALSVAMEEGIPIRIAHAHYAGKPESARNWVIMKLGHIFNQRYATHLIGCGQLAGEIVFGKSFDGSNKRFVLPNAIDANKFRYDQSIRDEVRKELGIEQNYVVGLIGRLSVQKNQTFIMPVIRKLHQIMPEMVLMLVGAGEEENKIKDYCKKHSMESYVIFTGVRQDVNRIYQGIDVCVLPSLYEGLPVVGVEALAAGCPLLMSDHITRELSFGTHVKYLPLEEKVWFDALKSKPINNNRDNGIYEIKEHGFDLTESAKKLERVYLNIE